ncbi:hypothetical protein HIM_04801 [Hirsutella minnesotensis 3608]|uniref:Ubiquitin thioesterase OTU n=1 Tax=Hirsutella minnesotensis 3608 TaxID=1043627 RepID=A0A0F8A5N6_9HYPO|nr:hypothetical protein HIM_04801 [Hirsutella minnesotensis 3608]
MRIRYKGPLGAGQIELAEDATVEAIFGEIGKRLNINDFSIKYGLPMAMRTLEFDQKDRLATSLSLHKETLTIVPQVGGDLTSLSQNVGKEAATEHMARSRQGPDDVNVPWPEREGTLRNCLFTAFGGALPDQIPAQQLRRMMAEYISQHPETYSEVVLGCAPSSYCRSIQSPDRWGGGIELSILSSIFDIQICTFDVQTRNMMTFGESQQTRCVLVYSGIHYDRVAFSYSDAPHDVSTLPPEVDCTIWPTSDEEIIVKTSQLVEKLHGLHYYTDAEGLVLRCDVPGCDWIGSGQVEGRKHAELTGHVDLSEIPEST